jgi:hypothetical protein
MGLPLHGGPVGEPGGGSFARTSGRKVYLGSFLGPGGHYDFKSGGHVELKKGTGLS